MSNHLIINKNSETLHFSGSQFESLENEGTKKLCVRTGVGDTGIKKYGLTSTPLSDKYSGLKMRISANNTTKYAHVAQRYYNTYSTTTRNKFSITSIKTDFSLDLFIPYFDEYDNMYHEPDFYGVPYFNKSNSEERMKIIIKNTNYCTFSFFDMIKFSKMNNIYYTEEFEGINKAFYLISRLYSNNSLTNFLNQENVTTSSYTFIKNVNSGSDDCMNGFIVPIYGTDIDDVKQTNSNYSRYVTQGNVYFNFSHLTITHTVSLKKENKTHTTCSASISRSQIANMIYISSHSYINGTRTTVSTSSIEAYALYSKSEVPVRTFTGNSYLNTTTILNSYNTFTENKKITTSYINYYEAYNSNLPNENNSQRDCLSPYFDRYDNIYSEPTRDGYYWFHKSDSDQFKNIVPYLYASTTRTSKSYLKMNSTLITHGYAQYSRNQLSSFFNNKNILTSSYLSTQTLTGRNAIANMVIGNNPYFKELNDNKANLAHQNFTRYKTISMSKDQISGTRCTMTISNKETLYSLSLFDSNQKTGGTGTCYAYFTCSQIGDYIIKDDNITKTEFISSHNCNI